ncbi:MAG: c-type cytochrome [Roseibacillus sp.]|nr:c-type cytochrome [Roseibacillus sp.]
MIRHPLLVAVWMASPVLGGAELDSLPLEPVAALKGIHVPDGFVVELMAAEPHVKDPVAFDWDTKGRLFVVEMADYPLGLNGKGQAGGRVRLLEDRDLDGRYDHSVLFADGLNFPNGILTWRNGIIVTAAPDVIFLRDRDGDGVSDEREVLLTGLSQGNQQLRANGLRWGLDNWVYVAAGGHHGKHAASTVVRSARNKSEVKVGSRDFRFHPDTGIVEPQSGPSQFGRNRDDWGRWFGTQNSRPLWHYVLPDHYLRRNPYLAAPDGRVQLPGRLNPPVYPASKLQKRYHSFEQSGHYTSACSGMIYRDRILFEEGTINGFSCEPFHNVVQRLALEQSGVTFRGWRAGKEKEPDFFASSDRWCRPVMVRTGPDGCLWVADMYRYMIEHPQWLPEKGKEELLPFYRQGEDRGRIYRVRRAGRAPRTIPHLAQHDLPDLVAGLRSPNGWVRDKVQQELLWRNDRTALPLVRVLAGDADLPETIPHLLGVMEGMEGLGEDELIKALDGDHAGIRENALRWAEGHASPPVVAAALQLVDDPDPRVRMQLAFSIGAFPPSSGCGRALARLLLQDHEEPFATIAALSAALPHLDDLCAALSESRDPALGAVARPLIEILLRAGKPQEVIQFLVPIFERARLAMTAEQLLLCVELDRLLINSQARIRELMKDKEGALVGFNRAKAELLVRARTLIQDGTGKMEDRLAAAALLARYPDHREVAMGFLRERISPVTPPGELKAVFAVLGGTGGEEVPAVLLEKWEQLSPTGRGWAADELFSRVAWTEALLASLKGGRIRLADLDATRRLRLRQHPNAGIRSGASDLLKSGSSPAREKVVEDFRPALDLEGDGARGRGIYRKLCLACHRHGEEGREVGPDLGSVKEHPPEKLLVNILNPNLDIQPGFHAYNCELKSGEVLFGLLASENAVSITFKIPDGTTKAILRSDIKSLKSVNLSLMPEGLEEGLSPQDLADLISFLRS